MAQTVYTNGAPGEMPEIIDFINYVFSQAHVPHDFKALLPKVYGDDAPLGVERFHFLAKQDGKIVGCVACRPTELIFGDQTLSCGFVGSVSVHPYHRGEGHMKRLMGDLIAEARNKKYDMLILGGQRQRYNYFGFERAGLKLNYTITKTNVRHALDGADVTGIAFRPMTQEDAPMCYRLWQRNSARAARTPEGFLMELRSWNRTPEAVLLDGVLAGYVAGGELEVADTALLPGLIKALVLRGDEPSRRFSAALSDREKIGIYSAVSEDCSLSAVEMINVLNWPKVLKTLLEYKHAHVSPVSDGECALDIAEDGAFRVSVQGGIAQAEPLASAPRGAQRLSHLLAQRAFFGISELFTGADGIDRSWRGLPFYMSEQDGF